MRAIVFPGPEQVEVTTVPEPEYAADQVVLKIAACGICGTDLHIFRNEYRTPFPIIPGHEFCGEVVAVGSAVRSLKLGDRVAADPNLPCGCCTFCRSGLPNHCVEFRTIGVTQAGAFAEYVAVPERACFLVPAHLSDQDAALIEPLSCVIHALSKARPRAGDHVLVIGAGPIGLLLAQGLAHSGAASVTMVERQAERLERAAKLGFATQLADEHMAERLREQAHYGFPFVADATGNPRAIEGALRFLRPGGTYLQFGVAPADATVAWSPYEIFRNEWTIVGSFALRYSFEPALAWLEQGVIKTEGIVSHTLSLAEFPQGFQAFAHGQTLKVQIRPDM